MGKRVEINLDDRHMNIEDRGRRYRQDSHHVIEVPEELAERLIKAGVPGVHRGSGRVWGMGGRKN